MCGIAGILRYRSDEPVQRDVLLEMIRRMRHRGPNDEGLLVEGTLGLAHTRLSIIDLSPLGHQPFSDESGNYTIVYNGEIYNYMELRDWLEARGHRFRSRTDTEVVLRSYIELGEACVERFVGMFAFAIRDLRRRSLFAARDRTGEKPFVYCDHGGSFTFASEIECLLAAPDVPRSMDPIALGTYLATGKFIPYPRTAYQHIKKLPPAHRLTVDAGGVRIQRYWAPDFSRKTGDSLEQSVERLDALLEQVVKSMMMSDVPIGLLLSGGVDSSLIAYKMRAHTSRMHTFSCGGSEHDEEFLRARQVATRLSTVHAEHVFSFEPNGLLRFLDLFGEPIFDASLPYRLQMCEFVKRQGVTVLLTGNGGDEVFGGYEQYSFLRRFARLKRLLASMVTGRRVLPAPVALRRRLQPRVELHGRPIPAAIAGGITSDLRGRLERLGCSNPAADEAVEEVRGTLEGLLKASRVATLVDGILCADLMLRLHYNHVMIPDGVGMSQSLELRSPFLDSRLIEFAASLPDEYKVHREPRYNKRILKLLLERWLPRGLVYSHKIGYGGNIPYLERGADAWAALHRRMAAGSCIIDLRLADRAALGEMTRWEPAPHRNEMGRRVSVVILEMWLDRNFGSGDFVRSISGSFAPQAGGSPRPQPVG